MHHRPDLGDTEHRKEDRDASKGYEDVGFRVIQVLNVKEPEQKIELISKHHKF